MVAFSLVVASCKFVDTHDKDWDYRNRSATLLAEEASHGCWRKCRRDVAYLQGNGFQCDNAEFVAYIKLHGLSLQK